MASALNKETLAHLAKLARIELDPKEEEKFLRDLGKILDYFDELQGLETSAIDPVAHATGLMNAFREDGERERTDQGAGVSDFPKSRKGFLEVPPVFPPEDEEK
jgi:aspartyl-tRNA(Asn)/glutamyl-tRNA(Gln) amidotransferase subunit C